MHLRMMEIAFVLHHVRSADQYGEDAKLIGVYRSEESAREAIARLEGMPGFRDHVAGFEINGYPLDKDHWSEGFVTLSVAAPEE